MSARDQPDPRRWTQTIYCYVHYSADRKIVTAGVNELKLKEGMNAYFYKLETFYNLFLLTGLSITSAAKWALPISWQRDERLTTKALIHLVTYRIDEFFENRV